MIKIGIFPNILDEDNKYETKFVYLKRYLDHLDAVPILLVIKDDLVIDEHLSMCDCFLIPGGDSISKACINLLKYAYECKKPVLGICLGMQALAVFSSIDDFSSLSLAEDFVVKKIGDDSHFKVKEKVLDISSSLHPIFIEPSSRLYRYVNKQIIDVHSFHLDMVSHISKLFKVSAFSYDGVLEGIESTDDWLAIGLQFHPELGNDLIIEGFINDVRLLKEE